MYPVGIRELKATFSRHLERVRRGEVVLVTDRGRVVAELRPPGQEAAALGDDFERRLSSWVQSGRVAIGTPNSARVYAASPLRCPPGTSDRLLAELRADS